jgi:hypothetical protein
MSNENKDLPNTGIHEALWDAYRRDDKAAVMDYLFRRSLVGICRSRSFSQLVITSSLKKRRAARRAHGEPVLIDDGPRQIPLRSRLN